MKTKLVPFVRNVNNYNDKDRRRVDRRIRRGWRNLRVEKQRREKED